MKPNEFTAFDVKKPNENKHLIVTNNINAKNAHGEMSNVWLTSFLTESKRHNCLVAFDDADRCILGLTHWKYA